VAGAVAGAAPADAPDTFGKSPVAIDRSFRVAQVQLRDVGGNPPPPGRAYQPSELVTAVVQFVNVPYLKGGAGYRTRLRLSITVTDEKDVVRDYRTEPDFRENRSEKPPQSFPCAISYRPSRLAPGEYTLGFVLTDAGTGRAAKGSVKFKVAAPDKR
jgi:hypothetical protein